MVPKLATTDRCILQQGWTQSFAAGCPGTQLLSHRVQRQQAIPPLPLRSSPSVLPIPNSSTFFPHFLSREQSNGKRHQLQGVKTLYKQNKYILYK